MPHLRKRYIEEKIRRSLTHSPIVGVLGQRQVGKTTLLEKLSGSYATFDRESDLLEAEDNPEFFLKNRESPFAIDESQMCPRLFPALKESVRLKKIPGLFLLSGSVRFTSREIIRESLTGRIVNMEVLPFTIREAHGFPEPVVFKKISSIRRESDLQALFEAKIHRRDVFYNYLLTGGLPGIAFFRETQIRKEKFESQIDTLLNRDIRLVIKTSLSFNQLRALLKFIALNQGKGFELKEAMEYSQISTVTLKRILYAFESLFLIRPVSAKGGEKKTAYFFEDQGLATWITGESLEGPVNILRGIYSNLRQELYYGTYSGGTVSHFRTKHGVNVPLVFDTPVGMIGIIPCQDETPPAKTLGSALAFLKKFPKACVVIAANRDTPVFRDRNFFILPYFWLV